MYDSVQQALDLLDDPDADGSAVEQAFSEYHIDIDVTTIETEKGSTDFINFEIPGSDQNAPTLGIVGRLGGVGARPEKTGIVSDADGAIIAIAAAFELAQIHEQGDGLPGDVIIGTHICPDAPIIPHEPVPFMSSPVDMPTMNEHEIDERMDAILSIDATKGTRVHSRRGFAITPTVKEGWILRTSESLLDIQERVSGEPPVTLTLTPQDIIPRRVVDCRPDCGSGICSLFAAELMPPETSPRIANPQRLAKKRAVIRPQEMDSLGSSIPYSGSLIR